MTYISPPTHEDFVKHNREFIESLDEAGDATEASDQLEADWYERFKDYYNR